MKGLFMDAVDDLAEIFRKVGHPDDPHVDVVERGRIAPEELPALLAGYDFVLDDHTQLPTEAMRACSCRASSESASTCCSRARSVALVRS